MSKPKVEIEFDPRDVHSLFPFGLGPEYADEVRQTLISTDGEVEIYIVAKNNNRSHWPDPYVAPPETVHVYTVPTGHEITIEVRKHVPEELPF